MPDKVFKKIPTFGKINFGTTKVDKCCYPSKTSDSIQQLKTRDNVYNHHDHKNDIFAFLSTRGEGNKG